MTHPALHDFGVTDEEYSLYDSGKLDERAETLIRWASCGIGLLGCGGLVWVTSRLPEWLGVSPSSEWLFWFLLLGILGTIVAVCSITSSIEPRVVAFKKTRLLESPVGPRIKRYEEALQTYHTVQREAVRVREEAESARRRAEWERQEAERAQRREVSDHWMSLSGIEFEEELGALFRQLDYRVEPTATSGDQGVDLILRKNGKTTVVQCKSHKSPVGPAIARELLGSMVAFHADDAILACTGGFTKGVTEFVRDHPIQLISAQDLTSLANVAAALSKTEKKNAPVCPVPGCRELMVLRTGRHGKFWGCPRYPDCRGSRDLGA